MFNSIYGKLILFVYLPIIFLIGIFSYVLYSYQRHNLMENIMVNAERVNKTINNSLTHAMLMKRRDEISIALENLVANKQVLSTFILNPEGRVSFAGNYNIVKIRMDKMKDLECKICHQSESKPRMESIIYKPYNAKPILRTKTLIHNEKRCYCHNPMLKVNGMLITDFSLDEMEGILSLNKKVMVICFLAVSIILIGITRFSLKQMILSPLSHLLEATQKIGSGDLDHKILINSTDEIGRLVNSFNEMALSLKQSRQEVEEWNRTLEQRVEERTQELKAAQDQLVRAGRMVAIGELAAGVAHELNNPLTGILGYAQYALEKLRKSSSDSAPQDPSLGKLHQYLSYIEREAQRCKKIIQNLLCFSRAPQVAREPLDVNPILEETLALCGPQLESRKVILTRELDPALPRVVGNASQLQQVFTNIILNAYDAMPEGGSLTIITQTENGLARNRVKVEFIDTGCGIPKENIGRVFEPFFTTKEVGKGTGLGLAISYGIIRDHQGNITVNSEVGKGSNFTVILPTFEI